MAEYDNVPSRASVKVDKFELSIPDEQISDLKTLLRLSPLAPETYENLHTDDGKFGVSYEWMKKAKEHWLNKYDWRKVETYNNSFPNYIAHVKDDDGETYRMHFAALFSKQENAIPILYMHGWPGSHFEFLDILNLYRKKYSPEELPYHVIAATLPGWTLSSGPPLTRDFDTLDVARLMNKLMHGLGFGSGYVIQGGDIGSFTGKVMIGVYDECKAAHFNFAAQNEMPPGVDESQFTEAEKHAMETRAKAFYTTGIGYAKEHGTRPATIGFALSASPLSLLAWIGEKFIEWTDVTPPLDQILDSISLYWFTQSFARCIYTYREYSAVPGGRVLPHSDPKYNNRKPIAWSWYPKEVFPVPKAWAVAQDMNLVLFRQHEVGGHFAVMEQPEEMMQDMEDFLQKIGWPLK
ncbi:uncharacterized protein PV06_03252 [Exophiala oligosperma]|uniref:Epoxide hydrolase N-terminal domain-containing protein n=2 Tax=Exophiala oligosperma TaxID=215243 RepID=A0A0D2AYB0_9EURO|nr:uncharacterized protein PV06_03252 [Exophiala oligosperma]KIW44806.1 hypothetical protein PV06_03252 [Exophiala oligosperma]